MLNFLYIRYINDPVPAIGQRYPYHAGRRLLVGLNLHTGNDILIQRPGQFRLCKNILPIAQCTDKIGKSQQYQYDNKIRIQAFTVFIQCYSSRKQTFVSILFQTPCTCPHTPVQKWASGQSHAFADSRKHICRQQSRLLVLLIAQLRFTPVPQSQYRAGCDIFDHNPGHIPPQIHPESETPYNPPVPVQLCDPVYPAMYRGKGSWDVCRAASRSDS